MAPCCINVDEKSRIFKVKLVNFEPETSRDVNVFIKAKHCLECCKDELIARFPSLKKKQLEFSYERYSDIITIILCKDFQIFQELRMNKLYVKAIDGPKMSPHLAAYFASLPDGRRYCNQCQTVISGIYLECLECPDIVLCDRCDGHEKSTHLMVRVNNTDDRSIVRALKKTVSQSRSKPMPIEAKKSENSIATPTDMQAKSSRPNYGAGIAVRKPRVLQITQKGAFLRTIDNDRPSVAKKTTTPEDEKSIDSTEKVTVNVLISKPPSTDKTDKSTASVADIEANSATNPKTDARDDKTLPSKASSSEPRSNEFNGLKLHQANSTTNPKTDVRDDKTLPSKESSSKPQSNELNVPELGDGGVDTRDYRLLLSKGCGGKPNSNEFNVLKLRKANSTTNPKTDTRDQKTLASKECGSKPQSNELPVLKLRQSNGVVDVGEINRHVNLLVEAKLKEQFLESLAAVHNNNNVTTPRSDGGVEDNKQNDDDLYGGDNKATSSDDDWTMVENVNQTTSTAQAIKSSAEVTASASGIQNKTSKNQTNGTRPRTKAVKEDFQQILEEYKKMSKAEFLREEQILLKRYMAMSRMQFDDPSLK